MNENTLNICPNCEIKMAKQGDAYFCYECEELFEDEDFFLEP